MDRPRITLTYAQSLDARIATATGDSQWISGAQTLRLAHELRNEHQGILVGIGTVVRDDPRLSCRIEGGRNPHRYVLDSSLRTPSGSHLVSGAREIPTTIFCDRATGGAAAFESRGVTVARISRTEHGLSLPEALAWIARDGVSDLLVEGGSRLLTALYRERLVDRAVIVCAPLVIGAGTDAVGDLGTTVLNEAWRGRTTGVRREGDDVVWEVEFA